MAWTVPAVAVATAAPAFAASPVSCPAFPDGSLWTTVLAGELNNAPRSFVGNVYTMATDSNALVAGASPSVTVTSPTINVTSGTTYNLALSIRTRYGVNGADGPLGTVNTNFTASATGSITGGTVSRGPYSTQAGHGGTVVTPINGGFGTATNVTLTFTATSTGTVTLRYAFSMNRTIGGNNDDYQITSSFSSCTRN